MVKSINDRVIMGVDPGTLVMGYGIIEVRNNSASLVIMGVIDMRKVKDPYLRLQHINERITILIKDFKPNEFAIEAPFYGKNVQSMLKLGRAQGVAMAAALARNIPITEYAPTKIKMAVTGMGAASKEQVGDMLKRILHIPQEEVSIFNDATDALGVAYCHYLQLGRPKSDGTAKSWKEFITKNPRRTKGL